MVHTTHALENSLMGSKASRNTSIEALRLVAVAGIAIFHTFQWTFQAVCTGLPEYAPLAHMTQSAVKSHNGPADRLQSVGGACR